MKMLKGILNGMRKIGVGLAFAGALMSSPEDSSANISLTPTYWTTGGVDAGTNLVLGQNYVMRLQVDLTGEPTRQLGYSGWTITFPTNCASFTAGYLPTIGDIFQGWNMSPTYNYVDNVISGNTLADNSRNLNNPLSGGPSNTVGYLGFYDFTTTSVASNRPFTLSAIVLKDTANLSFGVTINQNRFNVSQIPEPNALALALWGLGGLFVLNRWKRRK
jgi:hypothetical protein